jgi:PBSX family phage portal protein
MSAEYIEDSESSEIHITSSNDFFRFNQPQEDYFDPFKQSISELNKYKGLSSSVKRKNSRAMQKFHQGVDGTRSKKIEDPDVTGYVMFEAVEPPYNMDYLSRVYEVSSPHHAAVDAKVSNIVGLGFDLIESIETKEKLEEVEDSDSEKLNFLRRKISRARSRLHKQIDDLNEDESFTETMKKIAVDYEATGNGYMEVGRKIDGTIGYLGHIPSANMRVRRNRDGFIQIVNNRIVFFRNYGDTKTSDVVGDDPRPNEVIHFKKYTPTNNYYGVPDIIPALPALAGDEFASKFNLDYFENKAVPRYIIVVKGAKLSDDSQRKLLEFFQTGLKGKNHRSLYIPLPADDGSAKVEFKMEPVEAGIQDSSFRNYRVENRDEILMAHRVPVTKVSMASGISLAAARDADKNFREQVTKPTQQYLEKKINKIVHEFTDMFDLEFNELSLTDEDTQSKIDERYLRMQVLVPNEIRARKGLPALDSGDTPIVLNARASAEQNTQASGNRRRDQERQGNQPDIDGEARNPQGDGRSVQ